MGRTWHQSQGQASKAAAPSARHPPTGYPSFFWNSLIFFYIIVGNQEAEVDFHDGDMVRGRILGWDEARAAEADDSEDGPDGALLMQTDEFVTGPLRLWNDPTNKVLRAFIGDYEVEKGSLTSAPRVQQVLAEHHVWVPSDNGFQRRARLLQALWREERGYPIGEHRGRPLGSRLRMPDAEKHLWNYLTEGVRTVVRQELQGEGRDPGKLFSKPRIFNDLLSSQPLCFNLFGELKLDLELATEVARVLWADQVDRITRIEFEYSPGRRQPDYLSNLSAFDVYLEHTIPGGGRGFIGIEVKYHENLKGKAAVHRERYDEVAVASGVFKPSALGGFRRPPLQQLWLDHLLALSVLSRREFSAGQFVLLYPRGNRPCEAAWEDYSARLADHPHAAARTMDEFLAAISAATSAHWVKEFHARYLAFEVAQQLGA